MIDINKAEEWHGEIADMLRNQQLLEAFGKMNKFATEVADWNLTSELENMYGTYQSLLQCVKMGMEDPGRGDMYNQLRHKCLILNDRLYRAHGMLVSTAQYYRTAREMHKHPACNNLYDLPVWVAKQMKGADTPDARSGMAEVLFNLLWTSDIWSPTDRESLAGMVIGSLPENLAAVAVSAVTLGLLEMYDPQKYMFLLDIYQGYSSPIVSQRAIVGIALGGVVHDNRMRTHLDITFRILEAGNDATFVKELQQVQMYLLRQCETEKINKFMNEEFLPEMMKNPMLKGDKIGIESLNIENNLNPEWEKWIESKDVRNKMNIMSKFYNTGADIHMASFASMKNFPFFRQVANWFLPFDSQYPAIADVVPVDDQEKRNEFLRMLVESSEFCDSDCYSLFLFLGSLPQSTRETMGKHLPELNGEMREQLEDFYASNNGSANLCKKYIQNLYRFYKLYAYRHEFTDIFQDEEMNLQYCDTLQVVLGNADHVHEVALYLFTQKHYEEADSMYSELECLVGKQAEIMQKRGFCMQQLKRYGEAVSYYKDADLLQPSHLWTLTHLAQCLYADGHPEEAVEYFLKAEELAPEDLNLLLQTGNCLAQLERYDEAFKRFFKVHYLDEHSITVCRAIAWYSLLAGRMEQAERFYRLIEKSDGYVATEVDMLNIGHMHWLAGRNAEALRYYNECCSRVGKEVFKEMLKQDAHQLIMADYPSEDIHIVIDLVTGASF